MDRGEHLMEALWDMMNKKRVLDQTELRTISEELNTTELRCIEYVGRNTNVNATRLAEAFYMTTGAASKLTKKLLAKGLVSRYQKLENRKEVYFRLTEEGESLFEAVSALRERLSNRDAAIFDELTPEQYDTILRFVGRYSDHLDHAGRRPERRVPYTGR